MQLFSFKICKFETSMPWFSPNLFVCMHTEKCPQFIGSDVDL